MCIYAIVILAKW